MTALTPALDIASTRALLKRSVVITVPEAGSVFGLKKTASYAAVKRGELPTVAVGGHLLVPSVAIAELIGIDLSSSDER